MEIKKQTNKLRFNLTNFVGTTKCLNTTKLSTTIWSYSIRIIASITPLSKLQLVRIDMDIIRIIYKNWQKHTIGKGYVQDFMNFIKD
jgi:hypothetical protein